VNIVYDDTLVTFAIKVCKMCFNREKERERERSFIITMNVTYSFNISIISKSRFSGEAELKKLASPY